MSRLTKRHAPRESHTSLLADSHLQVEITDLLAEYRLSHRFRNEGGEAVEAVYTFPVPLDAAFLGMEATLAGEQLTATVTAKSKAARRYDDALAEGDSAVLLESLRPGLLCVNLGNLKPGEDGEIVLRFAAPLRSCEGAVRFSLPLVHRPRYGRSKLDELETPAPDFAVEHPLAASIHVRGLLAGMPVSCATHAVRFANDNSGTTLQLNQAMLDRDLALVFDLPADFRGQARRVKDGEATIGLLSFNTPPSTHAPEPCEVCLVLDGSGSMQGDAIVQSRAALRAVAEALQADDRIQVLCFGSSVVRLFRRPMQVSERVREVLNAQADAVDANLGGTKMSDALESAIDALSTGEANDGRNRAIILVTDGGVEPEALDEVRAQAEAEGIRIFVVAVGSSAGVDVLTPLAHATGAVLERAVPAEPIDEVVLRQLRRLREAQPLSIQIEWSDAKARPLPVSVTYPGDAVMAMAFLPDGKSVRANVRLGDAQAYAFTLETLEEAPALRALAGQCAYQHAARDERAALALRYGLISQYTSAVLVKVRAADDKIEGLPRVKAVSPMLPHGMALHMAYSMAAPFPTGAYLDIPRFQRRQAVHLSIDLSAAEPSPTELLAVAPLTAARRQQVMEALHAALVQCLFVDGREHVDIDRVLAHIAADLHKDVHRYLAKIGRDLTDIHAACGLLEYLVEQGVGEALSEDEEVYLVQCRKSWLRTPEIP
ncbi:MAG: VWA domain-containing protein [Xanthomonadales bacterium]|nr:VWA domain-containing protein [Xanthomonadales bacterium]